MARWSDLMKLSHFEAYGFFLKGKPGCYEIGYLRAGEFSPKYIGRAGNLWTRIKTYMDPARCHNPHIGIKLCAERHTLWFRVIRTERYHGLEARHQARHGVGDEGIYEWNRRIEWEYLRH